MRKISGLAIYINLNNFSNVALPFKKFLKIQKTLDIFFRILHDLTKTFTVNLFRRDVEMGQANQISSIFWLILGLAVTYGSFRLGLGTLTHPGPGFLPFWYGVILAGLSILVFFQGKLARRSGDQAPLGQRWEGMHWSKSIYVVLAILVYTLTFTQVGFLLCTTFLLIFLLKAIDPETWAVTIAAAVIASLVSFVVFALWLDVQLPRGFLERMLF